MLRQPVVGNAVRLFVSALQATDALVATNPFASFFRTPLAKIVYGF